MTDTFNLVPTNNLEKHLDNILRAASGEEPQYDLAPNWRVEQYLAAIASALASGGGGGGGGVLVVNDVYDGESTHTLDKTWQEIHDAMLSGGAVISHNENYVDSVCTVVLGRDGKYSVTTGGGDEYLSSTASGYPVLE